MTYDAHDGDNLAPAVHLSDLLHGDSRRVPLRVLANYPLVVGVRDLPDAWPEPIVIESLAPLPEPTQPAYRPRRWCWLTSGQWACIGLTALFAGYMLAEVWGWWR